MEARAADLIHIPHRRANCTGIHLQIYDDDEQSANRLLCSCDGRNQHVIWVLSVYYIWRTRKGCV